MKRSPLRRRTPLRANRAPTRARSLDPLAIWCEADLPGCAGRAVHRHHIQRRSQGGSDGRSNTTDICGACHRFIHENPAWAYEHGWLRRRAS